MLENENIRLIQGDCIEMMNKLIADGIVVDVVIMNPPYIDYPKIK